MGVCLHAVVNGLVIFVPPHGEGLRSQGGISRGPHPPWAPSWPATTAPYSAAKAAVNNLIYSYNESLKPYGGGATVLCPGNINSNIGEAEKYRPLTCATPAITSRIRPSTS